MKVRQWITVVACGVLALAGCANNNQPSAQSNHDQQLAKFGNDLADRSLTRTHDIKADDLVITTRFSTMYDAANWQITSNKTLVIELSVQFGPTAKGTSVLMEHMHSDVSLLADSGSVNGMLQDSMDSSIHGGGQPGFAVDLRPYGVDFSIEGLSKTLIDGWGFAVGDYGAIQIQEKRLTEEHLKNDGKVTGNKITTAWILLVKHPDELNYHEVHFVDEFAVPVKR